MHLMVHHFQVSSLDVKSFAVPVRDTVLVPVDGAIRVAFDADNPGHPLFCLHNLYHMTTGVMTEVACTDFA
jgi:FtsP/CotA-like multicopper oxidase with cupredoxin domain